MMLSSLLERTLIIDTIEVAVKKEALRQKNKELAHALLLEISGKQVSYVTEKKNESTE
jgi:hypothetical protein